MDFPSYHPSTRTYTGSDWNTKRFPGALTKREQTLRLSSNAVASGGKLQLSFANQPDSVARSILQHYHAMTGSFKSFNLSAEILKDWDSIYRPTLKGGQWTYDAPPQVTTSHPGYSTTSVRLLLTKAAQEAKSTKKDPVGPPKPPECEPPLLPALPANPGNGGGGGGGGGGGSPDGPTPIPSPGPGDRLPPGPEPEPPPEPDPGDPGIPLIPTNEGEILYPDSKDIRVELTGYNEGNGTKKCNGSAGGKEPGEKRVTGYNYYTYESVRGIRWYTQGYFTSYTCNRSNAKIYPLKAIIVIEVLTQDGIWVEQFRSEVSDKIEYSTAVYSTVRNVNYKEVTNVYNPS